MRCWSDLRDQSDFKRPYDLLERALIRHDIRRRLIARLGSEAEDGIDAMLSQALGLRTDGGAEPDGLHRLARVGRGDGETRSRPVEGRDPGDDGAWREGPRSAGGHPARHRRDRGGAAACAWCRARTVRLLAECPVPMPRPCARGHGRAEDRERAERNRLLYVALTRAESWLIVAAAGNLSDDPEKRVETWYGAVEAGLQDLGAAPLMFRSSMAQG
jgi:ATP-dependent helicase/nuclease subunit A